MECFRCEKSAESHRAGPIELSILIGAFSIVSLLDYLIHRRNRFAH